MSLWVGHETSGKWVILLCNKREQTLFFLVLSDRHSLELWSTNSTTGHYQFHSKTLALPTSHTASNESWWYESIGMRPEHRSTLLPPLLLTLQVWTSKKLIFSAQFYIVEHIYNLQPFGRLSMKYITTERDALVSSCWMSVLLLNHCTAQRWKINSCAD